MIPEEDRMQDWIAAWRLHNMLNQYHRSFEDNEEYDFIPQDILSKDGTPLLSWRVALWMESTMEKDIRFNLNAPWDSTENFQYTLTLNRPRYYMYPNRLDRKRKNIKTCALLIKEIADELHKNFPPTDTTQKEKLEQIKDKAFLIIVDPKYAVTWTEPKDISWKELASGQVKPYTVKTKEGNKIYYLSYKHQYGISYKHLIEPTSYEEWEEFCGLSTQNNN
jgi:hypothetical protein